MTIVARDIFIRLTDPKGVHPDVVNYHRTWDADAFVASQRRIYEQAKDEDDRRLVSVVSKLHLS